MKKLFFALIVLATFASCHQSEIIEPVTLEATIIGRWQAEGFEDVVRYEFTEEKRYTIYSADGTFPTLYEFFIANPEMNGNEWYMDGETVVVDLNFGNYSRLIPQFNCDNNVINWISEDGADHSTFFRNNHDINECN